MHNTPSGRPRTYKKQAESVNNVFGRTVNPLNRKVTSGGSSGGESALITLGGSPLGVGTDIVSLQRGSQPESWPTNKLNREVRFVSPQHAPASLLFDPRLVDSPHSGAGLVWQVKRPLQASMARWPRHWKTSQCTQKLSLTRSLGW